MQEHYQYGRPDRFAPSPGIGIIQTTALRLKVKRLQATSQILQVPKQHANMFLDIAWVFNRTSGAGKCSPAQQHLLVGAW